jgi:hypothetical protein
VLGVRGNSLREVRSFTISHDLETQPNAQRRFSLALDTPEMVPIGQCSQPLSRLAVTPDLLSPEAFALNSFGNRPGSVLASAAAGMPIERFDLCRSTRFAFAAPLDPREARRPAPRSAARSTSASTAWASPGCSWSSPSPRR